MAKILVVEDDPGLRFVYERLFENSGHQVRICRLVAEAIAELERETVDLIILDFWFPGGIRGDVLLDWLVARGTLPNVVLVSGQEGTRFTAELTYPRLFRRLGKPFDIETLLEIVDRFAHANPVRIHE